MLRLISVGQQSSNDKARIPTIAVMRRDSAIVLLVAALSFFNLCNTAAILSSNSDLPESELKDPNDLDPVENPGLSERSPSLPEVNRFLPSGDLDLSWEDARSQYEECGQELMRKEAILGQKEIALNIKESNIIEREKVVQMRRNSYVSPDDKEFIAGLLKKSSDVDQVISRIYHPTRGLGDFGQAYFF